jgi:hypothetical protein
MKMEIGKFHHITWRHIAEVSYLQLNFDSMGRETISLFRLFSGCT